MGLFSKLFGDQAEKAARDIFKDIANAANSINTQNNTNNNQNTSSNESRPQNDGDGWAQPSAQQSVSTAPSGFSWGEDMPAEENQFNFKGSYLDYFNGIFRSEFAQYRIECETVSGGKRHIFTFWLGEKKALVVELMAQSSASKKLRENCAAQGIPYLRYYYDHDGWWNTRSYVVTRTRAALGL